MLRNVRLVMLFDMLVNPSFKMTTSVAKIARSTRQNNLCACQLLKRYQTLFGRRLFLISLFYHLCFVLHCVFTFYHGSPRFHCATKYGLSLFIARAKSLYFHFCFSIIIYFS